MLVVLDKTDKTQNTFKKKDEQLLIFQNIYFNNEKNLGCWLYIGI